MFKFDFLDTPDETTVDDEKLSEKRWKQAEKIIPATCELTEDQKKFEIISHNYKVLTIKTLSEADVIVDIINKDEENCILKAESDHSDLETAEYEGGLKIWECTVDLMNYLIEEKVDFRNKRVLDLGCGVGILGIYALTRGATVDFQDYNKEVIENVTIPNVILNETDLEKCGFYCGDWELFLDGFLSRNDKNYDYILTSETIYNTENYEKLLNIFEQKIKSDGFVYVAAKNYYFGVGGNTREFEQHLSNRKSLTSDICWKCTEGVQREILRINKV